MSVFLIQLDVELVASSVLLVLGGALSLGESENL